MHHLYVFYIAILTVFLSPCTDIQPHVSRPSVGSGRVMSGVVVEGLVTPPLPGLDPVGEAHGPPEFLSGPAVHYGI